MATVKKGYVVFYRNYRYEVGMEIPTNILQEVLDHQGWKVEVNDGKQKREEKGEIKKEPEEPIGDREKKEIGDIASNRMIKEAEVKRKK